MLITNVVKKMLAEGFVRFENGSLIDKDGNIIDSISDPGVSGSSAPLYIAYASSPLGAGFTLTSDSSLEYIAFKTSETTPVAADFAGLWFHRKGLPGIDATGASGIDGQPAGIRVNFSTSTVAAKPGTGSVRFNTTDLSLATEMYLDETMPSGTDSSGFVSQWVSGGFFFLRLKTTNVTTLAIFKLTGTPADNGDWFTIPVVNLTKSSTTFANADECTYQYFGSGGGGGSVTEATVIAAGNFTRFADNGAGGLKMIDNANSEVKSASLVYKLPSITITGVSNIPAANTFPHGAVVRLHQDNLVGAGSNPMGIYVVADAVNNIWRPFGPQVLFTKQFGTQASPTLSLTAAGKFDLGAGGDLVVPAGLFNVGSKVRFMLQLRKVGTTTPVIKIYFGTDLSARENNSQFYSQSILTGADMVAVPEPLLTFITATTGVTSSRAIRGSVSADPMLDASTLLNIASAMKATIEASTLSGDTVHLLSYAMIWEY